MTPANPNPPELWRPLVDVAREAAQEVELRHEYPELTGLRTGVDALDEGMGELFWDGKLITVGGETGGGKTAFLRQLAIAFGHQAYVLHISLEDSARQAVKRDLANLARLNVGQVRKGFPDLPAVPQSLSKAVEYLGQLTVDSLDSIDMDVVSLIATVHLWRMSKLNDLNEQERAEARFVVIIDQLSHITTTVLDDATRQRITNSGAPLPPAGARGSETAYLEWQTGMLKRAAERQSMLVVLAHQLNESHGDDKPTLSSIRGSRGIVHKSDGVLIPWCPKTIPNPDHKTDKEAPKRLLNVDGVGYFLGVKMRDVALFEAPAQWLGAQQRWRMPGANDDRGYIAPQRMSTKALEGMRKLTELRAGWDAERAAALASKAPAAAVPATTPPATPAATPALPPRFDGPDVDPPDDEEAPPPEAFPPGHASLGSVAQWGGSGSDIPWE